MGRKTAAPRKAAKMATRQSGDAPAKKPRARAQSALPARCAENALPARSAPASKAARKVVVADKVARPLPPMQKLEARKIDPRSPEAIGVRKSVAERRAMSAALHAASLKLPRTGRIKPSSPKYKLSKMMCGCSRCTKVRAIFSLLFTLGEMEAPRSEDGFPIMDAFEMLASLLEAAASIIGTIPAGKERDEIVRDLKHDLGEGVKLVTRGEITSMNDWAMWFQSQQGMQTAGAARH